MSAERTCPNCGTPLSDEALAGLCRKCLGRLAFGSPREHPDADPTSSWPSRPQRFGDYELIEEIARGGMGVVYKARQLSLDRIVAVKMVLHGPFSSEEFVQRFRFEAQAAAALHHPNIVAIYEVGQHDGQHFFSMEYIEGQNLADLVREQPVPARRAAGYLKTIAEAMDYAHRKGVFHRDLKPSNLMLDIFDQPRVTDFGLAKSLNSDSQLTITGQALGSPGHMPPEQAAGNHAPPNAQGDVYSLGAILYHLVTGRPPFQGETLQEVLLQVQNTEPVPPRRLNPSVPADLQTICLKCLQKEPGRRYPSAQALAADLACFLANEPIHARPATPVQKLWLWCRRRPVPAALSGCLLLAVVLGVAGVVLEWCRAEQHAEGEAGQRRLAENYSSTLRLSLYAADVSLSAQAIQRGDYGLARRTLAALGPAGGGTDLRGFEWRYLWNLCRGDELGTLTGHAWIVTCAAFSPDGRLLASGSQDGTVRLWDPAKQEHIITLPVARGAVWSVAFTADSGLLMTAGQPGIQFWRTDTWQIVTNFPGQIATLSKTGSLLAVADSSPFTWENAGKVVLWDFRSGEKLRELSKPGRALALSSDARTLAAAGPNSGVDLWDVATGRLLRTLPTEASVWSMAFSPAGSQLVTAGWANDALVWDLSGTGPPRKLQGHSRAVWSVTFSPDGTSLFTTSSDQTIRSWDASTFSTKDLFRGHDSEVWCVAVSADGKLFATGGKDQTVRLWAAARAARQDVVPHSRDVRPLFSPDGAQVAVVNPQGTNWHLRLWNLEDYSLAMEVSDDYSSGFSADGTRLIHFNPRDGTLERWSMLDRTADVVLLAGLPVVRVGSARAGFSPGWETFFALDQAGLIRVWEAATGKLLGSVQGPVPPIRAVVLGPRGRHLALSLERENIVRVYDASTGHELQLAGHRDFVSGLAFSPDGATLATGSVDGTIHLWDIPSGKEAARLPGHLDEATDVAFSPDGRTLASLAHKDGLKLWHLPTRREVVSLDLPTAGMYLQFSPDGRHLAVTTEDNSLRLFDAPTLKELEAPNVSPSRGPSTEPRRAVLAQP